MRIFALCGSLRVKSYNRAMLYALKAFMPADSTLDIFTRLPMIPAFNPELKSDSQDLSAVADLRRGISTADAIVIATPEYVHGIPGALKNALDWLVGSGEFDGKVCMLVHVTPAADEPQWVRDNLYEVIRVMTGGHVVDEARVIVTGAFPKFDSNGALTDPATLKILQIALANLIKAASLRALSL